MTRFGDLFTTDLGVQVRYGLLRCVITSALVLFFVDMYQLAAIYQWHLREVYWDAAESIGPFVAHHLVAPVALIHQLANGIGLNFAFPGVIFLDYLLLLGELGILGDRLRYDQAWVYMEWPQPLNSTVVIVLSEWICGLSLLVIIFIRTTDFWRLGKDSFRQNKRLDFTLRHSESQSFTQILSSLSGRSLWVLHFSGETHWIIYIRAVISILTLTGIVGYAIWNIALEPIQEMWLTPTGVLWSSTIPKNAISSEEPGWNIVLTNILLRSSSFDNTSSTSQRFEEAISVKALWPMSDVAEPCNVQTTEDTSVVTNNFTGMASVDRHPIAGMTTVAFNCTSTTRNSNLFDTKTWGSYQAYIHPDFLVAVNFSQLSIPLELGETGPENFVHVRLGMTDDTGLILQNSPPTTMIPGVNLVGMADIVVRQQLGSNLGSLFMDTLKTFLLADIIHVWADPRPVSSSLMVTGADVATIRVRAQASTSQWKVLQDSRDKTVLKGFSDVGGLWTALGGIFAFLFGSSLMKVILGSKPLSFFGMAHSLQRTQLRNDYLKSYPNIENELKTPEERRGLLNMICDELLDIDFLTNKEHSQTWVLVGEEDARRARAPNSDDMEKGSVNLDRD
ncbi:hypothetical protein CPB83DRAFT_845022 [Crepidotus variabilis]|uniref:Uncharacterized protein n=1 Tax=Crepidotus variabilis TaxID=179855 RepID=A0A9P6EQ96_9AGAR|nr:hypothetical protein CPB83DRAFT_845022 [Crepidotus variabilis]